MIEISTMRKIYWRKDYGRWRKETYIGQEPPELTPVEIVDREVDDAGSALALDAGRALALDAGRALALDNGYFTGYC